MNYGNRRASIIAFFAISNNIDGIYFVACLLDLKEEYSMQAIQKASVITSLSDRTFDPVIF